jgi:hypothetical protein
VQQFGIDARTVTHFSRRDGVDPFRDARGGSRPEPVLLGVSAPRAVSPGQTFSTQFVAYIQQFEAAVQRQMIDMADSPAQARPRCDLLLSFRPRSRCTGPPPPRYQPAAVLAERQRRQPRAFRGHAESWS